VPANLASGQRAIVRSIHLVTSAAHAGLWVCGQRKRVAHRPTGEKTKASVNLIALKAQHSNQVRHNPDCQPGQPRHPSPHSVPILAAIHSPGINAAVAYLHGCQMVGFKRLTELCEGLFGLTISQGAISNMLARMGKPFGAAAEQIAATVRASEVIASDETSARVKGKTHWQWAFGCATAVYHVIAPTRGKCVPTDFLTGARPKVWLSDRLPAQCTHAEAHQFCLAHLIRDAQYAIDHGDTIFAPQFKAFLKDACAVGCRRPDLADSTIATHRRRLDRELDRLLELKPTDVEGSHLRAAIAVTARDKLLVFLTRRDVEATNNASERALRPSVIFRRVTNGFRSEWGAKVYADLCSIVATGRLAGRSALAAIRDALAAPAPERAAARSSG
jgi:transposase